MQQTSLTSKIWQSYQARKQHDGFGTMIPVADGKLGTGWVADSADPVSIVGAILEFMVVPTG